MAIVARSIKILTKGNITIDGYEKNTFPKEYNKTKIENKDGKAIETLYKMFEERSLETLDSADNYKWWGIFKELNDNEYKGDRRLAKFKTLAVENCSGKDYIVILNLMTAKQGIVYGKIDHNKLVFTRDKNNATKLPKYTARYKSQGYPSARIERID